MTTVKAAIQLDVIDRGAATTARAEAAIKSLAQAELQAANATKVLAAASLTKAQTAISGATSVTGLAKAELAAARSSIQLAKAENAASRATRQLEASAKRAALATSSLAPAATTAAKATRGITQAQKLQGLGMAQNINLVSELAMGFGNMSPMTRGLGLAFATAGNNAFALASSLGPMGVMIGTLVGVVPALITMFSAMSDEADDAAESMEGARRSFSNMIDAQRSAREGQEGSRRLLEGEASTEELDDAIAVARQVRTASQRRESNIIRDAGGNQANGGENRLFSQQVFNAFRQSSAFQSGEMPTLSAVQNFAENMPAEPGGPRRRVTDPGIALQALRELQTTRGRSFDEGGEDRDASSGSTAATERIARLEERRVVAEARERREALEADAQAASSNVSVAQSEFDRQLDLANVSPRRAQRMRSDLAAANGDNDAIFRSGDLGALGENRGAVEAAAALVRGQREVAERRQAEIRAAQLERIRDEQTAQADASTRDLPGIGERAGGGGNGEGRGATRIAEAIRSDAEARERAREPGRLEVVLQNSSGERIGSATIAEGESERLELDADGAGPDGLGPI